MGGSTVEEKQAEYTEKLPGVPPPPCFPQAQPHELSVVACKSLSRRGEVGGSEQAAEKAGKGPARDSFPVSVSLGNGRAQGSAQIGSHAHLHDQRDGPHARAAHQNDTVQMHKKSISPKEEGEGVLGRQKQNWVWPHCSLCSPWSGLPVKEGWWQGDGGRPAWHLQLLLLYLRPQLLHPCAMPRVH